MKKIVIYREDKEYIIRIAYPATDEYETLRVFEKRGLRRRDLGYIVVNAMEYESFEEVCCEALNRAIKRDNYHRRED